MNYFLSLLITTLISLYSFNVQTLNGNIIPLNSYSGKKVLLVNIATGSPYKQQIAELQQLHNQYHDSLQIIAFPSNSFGHEPKDSAQLAQYFTDSVQVSFPVATLTNVSGSNLHPVYGWLANTGANGVSDVKITKDYQKILIDETGRITGLFNSRVSPLDSVVQKAIRLHINQ
jgi:glutathione peroxidase